MIPTFHLSTGRQQIDSLLNNLRLNPIDLALTHGQLATAADAVKNILADVAQRGDEAIVSISRHFDDPSFTADQIRVTEGEMEEAAKRISKDQRDAIRRTAVIPIGAQTALHSDDDAYMTRPSSALRAPSPRREKDLDDRKSRRYLRRDPSPSGRGWPKAG